MTKNEGNNTVGDGEEQEIEAAAATRKLRSPERRKVETERFESLSIVATCRNSRKRNDGGVSRERERERVAEKKVLVGFLFYFWSKGEASGCEG